MKLTETELFKVIMKENDNLKELIEETDWRGDKYNELTAEEQLSIEDQNE